MVHLVAVMRFPKEVYYRFGIWSWAQHKKALGWCFKSVSCWSLGQNVTGLRIVKRNGKMRSFEIFNDHLGNLVFGMMFGYWINFIRSCVKCTNGF